MLVKPRISKEKYKFADISANKRLMKEVIKTIGVILAGVIILFLGMVAYVVYIAPPATDCDSCLQGTTH